MALPVINSPTFDVTIPSSEARITMRPFLVKEEKILLMALTSDDPEDMAKAAKQIINNCVLSEGFDIETLELYDLEFLMLQLRIKSIGETTKIAFKPIEDSECPECSKRRVVEIDLTKAEIKSKEGHDKKLQLTDQIGLVMKYPNAKMLELLETARRSKDVNKLFEVIWSCVETVYEEDDIHKASDVKVEEGVQFLENLSKEQFSKVEEFFQTMPKLSQTITVKCSLCDFEQDFVLEGLESFFV